MKTVKIANTIVGEGSPCFIIAEAGVNHNCDIELAKRLIDVAKEAGADAVKFQTFHAQEVVTKDAEKAEYQKLNTPARESQYDMISKLELGEQDLGELFTYAQKKDIVFLSSPFDKESVDLLDGLGVSAFKIPSGEITNYPLLKHVAGKKKPIILSTGMSTLGEIEEALNVIRGEGAEEIILLHCVSCYPAKIEDINLKAMETMRCAFNLPVGLSDHSTGISVAIAATALGACVIEKHFTFDKKLPGPDHSFSLMPDELRQMVIAIREVERAIGNGVKRSTLSEEGNKRHVRRSIVAMVNIPGGAVITEDMIGIKRPGAGIEPRYLNMVIGRRARKNIAAGSRITFAEIL